MKKVVTIGKRKIGGDYPVLLQSMTNTKTQDIQATVSQIHDLEDLGCEAVRLSANSVDAAKAFYEIKQQVALPLIADIHFNLDLAMIAIESGADKIRINPGNVEVQELDEVISCAKEHSASIRIGVNSGSIERSIEQKFGYGAEAMFESMKHSVGIFEDRSFDQLVLSAKSSDVKTTLEINKKLHQAFDYPLHIGVTEAGDDLACIVKSSLGLGPLLLEGIGQTLRVSYSGSPLKEIPIAKEILKVTGHRKGFDIIACPTCARTQIDLMNILAQVKASLPEKESDLRIAIMGCVVNGPGEARHADIGIAGGNGKVAIFKKGKVICTCPEQEAVSRLVRMIEEMTCDE